MSTTAYTSTGRAPSILRSPLLGRQEGRAHVERKSLIKALDRGLSDPLAERAAASVVHEHVERRIEAFGQAPDALLAARHSREVADDEEEVQRTRSVGRPRQGARRCARRRRRGSPR